MLSRNVFTLPCKRSPFPLCSSQILSEPNPGKVFLQDILGRPMTNHWGKKNFRFVMTLLVLVCVVPSVYAQLPTATVSGVVKDASGAVIPGVAVTAMNSATGLIRSALTSENGSYRFSALPGGTYEVRAEMAGVKSKVE